jgi:hypothetical protein
VPGSGLAPRGSLLRVHLEGDAWPRWCVLTTDGDGLPYDYTGRIGVVILVTKLEPTDLMTCPIITSTRRNGLPKQHTYWARVDSPLAITLDTVRDTGEEPIDQRELGQIDAFLETFFSSSKKY